jgi:phage tail-like protein
LPPGTHLRLFTFTADDPGAVLPEMGAWQAGPGDQHDVRVFDPAGRYLWIAGALSGGGDATPAVRALRVDDGGEGWERWLPAVYAREAARGALAGLLALLESGLDEQEAAIDGLPSRFDPGATPDGEGGWLDWLAGWQALELDARWSQTDRRRAVRRAFAAHARRGTPDGLREAIRSALGIRVWIEEPAAGAELWRLGDDRTPLGEDTMLADAEADGAVLGRTATLGRAHLIAEGGEGGGLFAGLAHRFCVFVHAGELSGAGAREALVDLVERERPGHTTWALRVVEPRARVGGQARVGVDAVVARPGDPLALGAGQGLGRSALGGARGPGRLGDYVHLGVDATVS